MDTLEDSKQSSRRRHSAALKAQVLAECAQPNASVASIAMAHGLNANLVHKWRRLAAKSQALMTSIATEFVALPLAAHVPSAASDIAIELRRGAITLKVTWPMAGAASCAAWIREVLR
ncbi:transposase [Variovorax sp. H27-G14]|uniref:IS66-like element accessory protein TnpA n=1 Tax=Variovorax sp. H27-G14 TaxID=3111914 RepID=UPI0038FC1710